MMPENPDIHFIFKQIRDFSVKFLEDKKINIDLKIMIEDIIEKKILDEKWENHDEISWYGWETLKLIAQGFINNKQMGSAEHIVEKCQKILEF